MILYSYYSTAFAYATFGCMIGFLATPFPESTTLKGSTMASAFAPLVSVVAIIVVHILLFAVFSSSAFMISLFRLRRSRTARWLVGVNCVGFAIAVLYGVGWAIEEIAR